MSEEGISRDPFYSEDKQIARFQERLMSNARWRDFFLTAASLELDYSEWKWVSGSRVEINRMPFEQDLWEARLADGYFQPAEYKYLERIFIPRSYKPYPGVGLVREQDVEGLIEALGRTGKKFPFETNEIGFTIYGYK